MFFREKHKEWKRVAKELKTNTETKSEVVMAYNARVEVIEYIINKATKLGYNASYDVEYNCYRFKW